MDSEIALNRVAVFATGYAKRFMEAHYDRLFSGSVGARLQQMQRHEKLLVEAVLYGAMTLAEERCSDQTPAGKFLKSILMDAPPELAKRLLNDLPQALDEANLWEAAASARPAWREQQAQTPPPDKAPPTAKDTHAKPGTGRMEELLRDVRSPLQARIKALREKRNPGK